VAAFSHGGEAGSPELSVYSIAEGVVLDTGRAGQGPKKAVADSLLELRWVVFRFLNGLGTPWQDAPARLGPQAVQLYVLACPGAVGILTIEDSAGSSAHPPPAL
jgi:hypothetical protein